MKEKILELLKERAEFVSGQEISERFGVSRTAVWKAIRQLEADGYEIEAVRNRGYCLKSEADVLSEDSIRRVLTTKWAGSTLAVYSEIDSTNNQAKRMAEEGAGHGLLVVGDHQSAGRGRRGRAWDSAAGEGIFMTLLLKPDILPGNASMLTLVMAMAVRAGIAQVTGLDTQIKWPNDIVYTSVHTAMQDPSEREVCDGRKVCGILTEMSAQVDCINHIVIGVGINVHNESFPEEVAQTAVSLYQLTGNHVSRAVLIAEIMAQFEHYYDRYLQTQDMSLLKQEYNAHLINTGRKVCVLDPKGEYTGTAGEINETGELKVTKSDGQTVWVSSGEVSVRGIYGYV